MRLAATIIRCTCAVIVALAVVPDLISNQTHERTRVIVRMADGRSLSELQPIVERLGGTAGAVLDIINAQVVELPHDAISALAEHPLVARVSIDRAVVGTMERTSATIGASAVR